MPQQKELEQTYLGESSGKVSIQPALVLDLDGTVRYSKNGDFINCADDIALFDDVEAKIWEYRRRGYVILGVSNQGGVAFGHKTWQSNEREIERTIALFEKNPFHIIKTCLHHEGGTVEPYCHRSLLRKPQIGMLALCEMEAWGEGIIVDWDNSIFVGDRPEDEACAENAGCDFIHANLFFGRAIKR